MENTQTVLENVEELITHHEDTLAKLKDIENTLNEGKQLDATQSAFLRSLE